LPEEDPAVSQAEPTAESFQVATQRTVSQRLCLPESDYKQWCEEKDQECNTDWPCRHEGLGCFLGQRLLDQQGQNIMSQENQSDGHGDEQKMMTDIEYQVLPVRGNRPEWSAGRVGLLGSLTDSEVLPDRPVEGIVHKPNEYHSRQEWHKNNGFVGQWDGFKAQVVRYPSSIPQQHYRG